MRRQQLLDYYMRRPLRTAHAIVSNLSAPHRSIWLKRNLDESIEVNGEVYPASFAVNFGTDVAEGSFALLWAPT